MVIKKQPFKRIGELRVSGQMFGSKAGEKFRASGKVKKFTPLVFVGSKRIEIPGKFATEFRAITKSRMEAKEIDALRQKTPETFAKFFKVKPGVVIKSGINIQ